MNPKGKTLDELKINMANSMVQPNKNRPIKIKLPSANPEQNTPLNVKLLPNQTQKPYNGVNKNYA